VSGSKKHKEKIMTKTKNGHRGKQGNMIKTSSKSEKALPAKKITERKRTAERQALSAYNRSLIEASIDPLVTINPDGKITDVNKATETITGVSRQELMGTKFSEYFTEPDKASAGYQKVLKEGMVRDYALELRHRDGHLTPVLYNASVYRDESGEVVGVFAAARDITERKQVEEKLRSASFYARSLIEASLDPLVTKNTEGIITDVNSATELVTGVGREKLIGSEFYGYFTEPDKARDYHRQVMSKGFIKDYPLAIKHISGKVTDVIYNASIYKDEAGNVAGVCAAARDITERKLAEEEIKRKSKELEEQNWIKTGQTRLNEVMHGETDLKNLATNIITFIANYLAIPIGAFYIKSDNGKLVLASGYALNKDWQVSAESFSFGQGLVGQAAVEKKFLQISDVPQDSIKMVSGMFEVTPKNLMYMPLVYGDSVKGVLELGSLEPFSDLQTQYLKAVAEAIAITIHSAELKTKQLALLEETQRQAEELQQQQEELKSSNEELEEQTQILQQSEEKLKAQQEEMEVTNEELQEKNRSLEDQRKKIEAAQHELEEKAEQLAIAGKYKSEFLANMSHELRTPLNSLLLLARSLSDNATGNLTQEQTQSARIIYESGNDLLALISEILDLSKIEAGQMTVQVEEIVIKELAESTQNKFQHIAAEKNLEFIIKIGENAPALIHSDRQRLEQIIRNLLANAFRFTEAGRITVEFASPAPDTKLTVSGLELSQTLAIAIKDTGIGIPLDKQKIIFEAFQQAETGTARKYGGTGLGLSISRELAALLGGEIRLVSKVGEGSTFILYLPVRIPETAVKPREVRAVQKKDAIASDKKQERRESAAVKHIEDDRSFLGKTDRILLVIEDDPRFAKLLLDQCHKKGFKCLAAPTGEEGLKLVEKYLPAAIILDLRLPGIHGMTVLEALKDNPATLHIPVHIMSVEDPTIDEFRKGAIGHLKKPATREELEEVFSKLEDVLNRKVKNLLVVEDDQTLRTNIIKLVGNGDVHSDEAASGAEALQALKTKKYDCIILDLGLPDMTGFQLLRQLRAEGIIIPPVVVYTGRELTRDEEMELRDYAESIIIKGVRSDERLLDETALFLHRVVGKMPMQKQKIITNLHDTNLMFKDKNVLIVDDDMRALFALSQALSEKGIKVLKAEDGKKALDTLARKPDIDLVLMDIMMPNMDGYETMQRIRKQEKYRKLPIIAVTAKAMKEDAARCLQAGASDYLPKPVDIKRLFSMMRVWLYQ
jgi:PAS domain S-box-containing protein